MQNCETKQGHGAGWRGGWGGREGVSCPAQGEGASVDTAGEARRFMPGAFNQTPLPRPWGDQIWNRVPQENTHL